MGVAKRKRLATAVASLLRCRIVNIRLKTQVLLKNTF